MACFLKCICGSCNIQKHRDDSHWPPPCVGRCTFSFRVSRCRDSSPLRWSNCQIQQVLSCKDETCCGAREYFRDGAIDPDYKAWSLGCRLSHSVQNVYRLWPLANISIEVLVGPSGQTIPPRDPRKIECRLNDMTRALAVWFIENRAQLESMPLTNGEHAKYLYQLTVKRENGESIPPRPMGRVHFASMAIDLFKQLMDIPFIESRNLVQVEFRLLLSASKVCEICGSKIMDEFIPFHNCRRCGQMPALHHGRCCPSLAVSHSNRHRPNKFLDIRGPYFTLHLLEFTLPSKVYVDFYTRYLRGSLDSLTNPL